MQQYVNMCKDRHPNRAMYIIYMYMYMSVCEFLNYFYIHDKLLSLLYLTVLLKNIFPVYVVLMSAN